MTRTHPRFLALRWLGLLAGLVLFIFSSAIVPGNSRLYDAIEKGDEARVRELLAAGADPNSRWRGFATGRTNRYQFVPLHYALWKGESEIAVLLVEVGTDPNTRNPRGEPALIAAADAGMTEVVRVLIAKGADVQVTSNYDQSTPLHKGPQFRKAGVDIPKDLEPEIRAMLQNAGAR